MESFLIFLGSLDLVIGLILLDSDFYYSNINNCNNLLVNMYKIAYKEECDKIPAISTNQFKSAIGLVSIGILILSVVSGNINVFKFPVLMGACTALVKGIALLVSIKKKYLKVARIMREDLINRNSSFEEDRDFVYNLFDMESVERSAKSFLKWKVAIVVLTTLIFYI